MKNLFLSIIILAAAYQSISGSACTCEFQENRFSEAAAVFYGKVLEMTRNHEKRVVIIKVKLERVFKGNISEIVTLNSDYVCSYNFQVGKNYLIYAAGQENALLETGPCRILYEKVAKQEMKYLEKGLKPKNPSKYKG